MKFLFDNNLPPAFAAGMQAFCLGADHQYGQIIHLKDKFPQNTADHLWIAELSKEGGWAIISQDGFRKNDLEREALRQSGLVVFGLSGQWGNHPYWVKAHNLMKWWPSIEDYINRVHGGAAVRVPWRHSGKFEQIRL